MMAGGGQHLDLTRENGIRSDKTYDPYGKCGIKSVVAEFLPRMEQQREFEQRLGHRFRELQNGRMSHVEELRALSEGQVNGDYAI